MPKAPIKGNWSELQREQVGPRGAPGAEDRAKMTQCEKKTPKDVDPGHTA